MDRERWEQAQRIFAGALELPESERDAHLGRECGDDQALRDEVRSLLDADTDEHSLLDAGAAKAADELGMLDEPSRAGQRIGPWKLAEPIGRGGMGSVYLAERADGEFEQQVALKLIKRGMDSEEILGRFRGERQILAHLDHPNIARFLDGGLSDDGLPWFTMEHVDGAPIDVYCDERSLSVDERLDLFGQVCRAVAYAQQNLVVHRDLKPSNILVTQDGTPKLLDFGIAKLLDDDGGGAPLAPGAGAMTRTGHRIMTPGYAAPEQVRGEAVTTATDVYSLGVVLYELLTGQRPYIPDDDTPGALERAICETDPPKPSTAVSRPGPAARPPSRDETTTTPERAGVTRRARPAQLSRKLSGDLDNIVLMALRKEPERRYGSAQQFLEDIERYRTGRPVTARADTVSYRMQKFLRRNRAGVATTAGVAALVIALVVFYTGQLARERDRARLEAEKAQSVADFLTGLFEVADPSESLGETITARELLQRGAEKIEDELQDQPEVRAQLMDVVGTVYHNLGLFADADSLLDRALEIRRGLLHDDDDDLVSSLQHLAQIRRTLGDYDSALELQRRALDMALRLHGPQHESVADAYSNLGWIQAESGRAAEAEENIRKSLALWTRLRGEEDRDTASVLSQLALNLNEQARREEAEPLFRRAVELQRRLLGDHPDLSVTLYNFSELLRQWERLDEAEAVLREALEIDRRLYGADHPDVAYDLVSLARIEKVRHHYAEAESLFRQVLEMRKRYYGAEHPQVAHSLSDVAGIVYSQGRPDEADSLFRASMEMHLRTNGPDFPALSNRYRDIGRIARVQGRHEEAVEWTRKAVDLRRRLFGERDPRVSEMMIYLAQNVAEAGDLDEAIRIQRDALEISAETRGTDHWEYLFHTAALAKLLGSAGRFAESEELFRETIEKRTEMFGADHYQVAVTRSDYGRMLAAAGRPSDARTELEAARVTMSAELPEGDRRLQRLADELAALPSATPAPR
ncbi:MAG TPA: tetratricopeptide repeat protein [bacterium]|nr:tetratricopeptide repeat protein [bacterium]